MDALTRLWWWLLRVLLVLVPAFVIVNAFMLLAGELADLPSGSEVIVLWGLALSLAWVGTRRLRAVTRHPSPCPAAAALRSILLHRPAE